MTDVADIARHIDAQLPEIAREVIRDYLDLSELQNQEFFERPDDREQHQTSWHQWGIITHTRVFLRHFDTDVPSYLVAWGVWDRAQLVLRDRVEGASRWDLLRISILLHDVGKFAARRRGKYRFHFAGHERLSGEIVRYALDLEQYGLTRRQIEYIARTAEDHFVLAQARKMARETGAYTRSFVESDSFFQICERIHSEHRDDFVEVGVLFLGDSLAKADPEGGPVDALSQYDVNIEASRRYLLTVLGRDAACTGS